VTIGSDDGAPPSLVLLALGLSLCAFAPTGCPFILNGKGQVSRIRALHLDATVTKREPADSLRPANDLEVPLLHQITSRTPRVGRFVASATAVEYHRT
jgi:hypothetical protein